MNFRATVIDDLPGMLDALGEPVVVDGKTIMGIYDHQFVETQQIVGDRPVVICLTSDVSNVLSGAQVTADETDYTVAVPQPDGSGLTTLILEAI